MNAVVQKCAPPSCLATLNPQLSTLSSGLLSWFEKNSRDLPWRRTSDPYAIWISEIMLQQTQVKTVIPYWERWMRELPDIRSFANAKPEKFLKLWEGLGYYTRVHNAHKAAQLVVEKFHGKFPAAFSDVLALSGIGRYTAGAICSIAFDQPTPILDGNVIRVLTRVFGITNNPREKQTNAGLWQLAEQLVVQAKSCGGSCSHLNQSLMELGALICTPRQPACAGCPLKESCFARRENKTAELPNLDRRTKPTARRFIAFVVKERNRYLVRQRPAGVLNAHLWEFPNVEVADAVANCFTPFVTKAAAPLCTIKHSITRYRITLQAFAATLPADLTARQHAKLGVWKSWSELQKLPFTSAHRRVAQQIESSNIQAPSSRE